MSAYDVADLYATFNREASGVTMGPAAPCCASCASCARGQPCEAMQAAGVEGAPCVGCGRPRIIVRAGVGDGPEPLPDPNHSGCVINMDCHTDPVTHKQTCTSKPPSCSGSHLHSFLAALPDARLGYGTNDMAAAYGVGTTMPNQPPEFLPPPPPPPGDPHSQPTHIKPPQHPGGLSGAGGDLMDIAFNGYRCAADGPGPAGTGSTDGGEHPTNCGCGACPIVQEMLDQKKAEDEANGVGAVYAAHRAPAPPPPAPAPITRSPPSSASRLAGLPDARLGYGGNDVADAYGVGAVPAGLGVTAAQIDQDLVRANTLAAAHQYATDDFTDAVQACDTACTDVIAAEQALSSTPSMSIIGTQSGIINQLIGNAAGSRMTTGNYETAYTAATTAYQAYLKDAALPANVTPSPTPAPAPAPAPPIVVLPTNPQPAPAPVVPAPAAASTTYAKPILYTAAAAGVALVGYAAYKRYYVKGGRKTLLPLSQRKTRVPSGRTMHSARTIKA